LPFEFKCDADGELSFESAITQALHSASLCWSKKPTGIFDDDGCKEIVAALLVKIIEDAKPQLGLATTRELLAELQNRIELDYFRGGGGLEYTSVDGRPDGGKLPSLARSSEEVFVYAI
jgi:hypothetical protein